MTGSWRDRSVFVTGATGMVGSWLVDHLLRAGARVTLLVRDVDPLSELYRSGLASRATVVNGALEDYWTLERALNEHEIEIVVHLGAQTIVGTAERSPLSTFEANIRGTYNLLEACRVHSARIQAIVIASSDKAYGEQEQLPYTEDMPLRGTRPYEVSKSCADLIAQAYHRTYGLPVAIARCGNVYGGGDLNWSRIVPGTIRSLWRGERPVIRSDGSYTRDYLYVEDVAQAYLLLAQEAGREDVAGEAFNFSSENGVTVRDLVELIGQLMTRRDTPPVVLNRAQGEIRHQSLSARKARLTLGWRPTYELREGLTRTIAWYEAFLTSLG